MGFIIFSEWKKRHISVVLFLETLYCAFISLILGIFFRYYPLPCRPAFLMKLVHVQAALGSPFSGIAVGTTLILFGIIFFLTFLSTLRQIRIASPIDLLRGGQVGEKKNQRPALSLVILGIVCLGIGYYISITATSPMETIGLFFVAVILVIVGTYLLFTAVTIAILKMLRKNKRYIQAQSFYIYFGMLLPYEANAVGLANICVLSTMVLEMMSVCILLYIGIEDSMRTTLSPGY